MEKNNILFYKYYYLGVFTLKCSNCGFANKEDALYCKNCGTNLTSEMGRINKLNKNINVLGIFIGLLVSIMVLFVGALSFGGFVNSGFESVTFYIGIVILAMAFFGSILTGLVCCRNFQEGAVNGAFLSLLILVLTGFILGIILFISVGVISALSNAFPLASTATHNTSSSQPNNYYNIQNLVEFIIFVILLFIAGIVGGSFGSYIRNGIKKINV